MGRKLNKRFLEEDKKEDGAPDPKNSAPVKAPPADSADHGDQDQDAALFKQLMAKYLGEDHKGQEPPAQDGEAPAHGEAPAPADHEEEVMKMAHEAMQAYEDMGYPKERAMHQAGHAMRLAKHMASKKEAVPPAHEEAVAPAKGPPAPSPATAAHEESAKTVKLAAEVASLKESLNKYKINEHLEKTLRESKMPMHMTKSFRDVLGEPESVKQIDMAFKIFKESVKAAIGGEANSGPDFQFLESRATAIQTTTAIKGFSDCLKD